MFIDIATRLSMAILVCREIFGPLCSLGTRGRGGDVQKLERCTAAQHILATWHQLNPFPTIALWITCINMSIFSSAWKQDVPPFLLVVLNKKSSIHPCVSCWRGHGPFTGPIRRFRAIFQSWWSMAWPLNWWAQRLNGIHHGLNAQCCDDLCTFQA